VPAAAIEVEVIVMDRVEVRSYRIGEIGLATKAAEDGMEESSTVILRGC
jgi:hypothetical protein